MIRRSGLLLIVAAFLMAAGILMPGVAQATFPGQNGKIAFGRTLDTQVQPRCVYTANSVGTGEAPLLPCDADQETHPRWSPDGNQIAYRGFAGQIDLINSDGTNLRDFFFDVGTYTTGHSWSPDGTELVVSWYDCDPTCGSRIEKVNATAAASTTIFSTTDYVYGVDWSPDGTTVAFTRASQLYSVRADGTNVTALAPGSPGDNFAPSWSPSGTKIAFVSNRDENEEIYVMNADGTSQTRLTDNVSYEGAPRWAPDGAKIIFESDRDDFDREIYVMNADGTSQTRVTTNTGSDAEPDWRPIPVSTYVRPKAASPVRFPLVPAYAQCTTGTANRTHGPPLASASCNPPDLVSSKVTVGGPESNGKPVGFAGSVRLVGVAGNTGTTEDEADVSIFVTMTDVIRADNFADYEGELSLRAILRVTDRFNSPHPGGPGAGTVSDHGLFATIPCTATLLNPNSGSTCNLSTSADALMPGRILEGKRTIWNVLSLRVDDGGADEDGDTLGDNVPYAASGIFVP